MRSAACVIESSQEIVSDEKCSSEEKVDKRSCKETRCPKWDFGDWSSVIYTVIMDCSRFYTESEKIEYKSGRVGLCKFHVNTLLTVDGKLCLLVKVYVLYLHKF